MFHLYLKLRATSAWQREDGSVKSFLGQSVGSGRLDDVVVDVRILRRRSEQKQLKATLLLWLAKFNLDLRVHYVFSWGLEVGKCYIDQRHGLWPRLSRFDGEVPFGGWTNVGTEERRHFSCDDLMTRRVGISVRKSRVKKDLKGKDKRYIESNKIDNKCDNLRYQSTEVWG